MGEYFLIFIAGVAGSFHCIGMCGGFACALGAQAAHKSRVAAFLNHLLYNTGRLTTYVFIGVVVGVLGQSIIGDGVSTSQRWLSVIAGTLMVVVALQFFGFLQRIVPIKITAPSEAVLVPLRSLLQSPNPMAPLAIGIFNGFLPCPLVYAFVAQAASSGDVLHGLLIMLFFGLGTFPAMLIMGGLGHQLSPRLRQYGVRLAGLFILFFGVITLLRGFFPMTDHAHMGL